MVGPTELAALYVGYNKIWGPMPKKVCSLTGKGGKLENLTVDYVALGPGSSGDDGRLWLEQKCFKNYYTGYE